MDTKFAKKALLKVKPLRICVTFARASFRPAPKDSKIRVWDGWAENTTQIWPGSHGNFLEKSKNHRKVSKLDPYSDPTGDPVGC